MTKKVFYCSSIRKCEINSYLGSLVCSFFKNNGFPLVSDSDKADIIVINTCAVDETREKMALSVIDYYLDKYKAKKQIIVLGCLAKISPTLNNKPTDALRKIILIGPKELFKLNQIFKAKYLIESVRANQIDKNLCNKDGFQESNFYILICQGCMNNCAYCAIKKAKGNVTSKPLNKVIAEFKQGLEMGFKHFILLGDDCGSYGVDIGTDFAELLNEINKIKGDYKIDIHYFEPGRLQILFPKINKDIFKKIYAIRIPLQSLSQRIIKLMNRHYNLKNIFNIVKEIKRISPSIILRTHIIYCYPTETRKEFMRNINHPLLRYFNQIHYYCYSNRDGTMALESGSKINRNEKENRVKKVKKLSEARKKYVFPYGDKLEIEGLDFGKPLKI